MSAAFFSITDLKNSAEMTQLQKILMHDMDGIQKDLGDLQTALQTKGIIIQGFLLCCMLDCA
jgi:hypothetical protein